MPTTTLEVKLVGPKEWIQLVGSNPRYEHVTEENLGFADPTIGKAYVKQTHWAELNKYLLQHEFEHLLEEEGTDEDEHGVRHKKVFKQGIGGLLTAPFRAIGRLGSSAKKASQTPQIPNLSQLPSVQQFKQQSNIAYAPLVDRLQNLSNTPLPENLASPINRFYDQQRHNLYSQFAMSQPGVSLSDTGPGSYYQNWADLGQRQQEALGQRQFEFQGNERQNIMNQEGVTNDQLSAMASLAGLDVNQVMAQTGLDAQRASQFRQLFGNLLGGAGQLGGAVALHGAGMI